MTSKEAIQIIKTYNYYNDVEEYLGQKCIHPDYLEAKNKYEEAQDIVEKDSEVLELLKELPFEIYQNGGGDNWNWFVDIKQSFKISEEKAIKLKEWLGRWADMVKKQKKNL